MVSKDGFLGRTIEPYKFGGRSVGGMIRVITMYSIILFRTIHAALYIIRNGVRGRTVSLIVGCIFGVIGTIFVIMSVAALGAAQGRRRVLGINWVSRTGRRTHTLGLLTWCAVGSPAFRCRPRHRSCRVSRAHDRRLPVLE
jgi:hypothetical protein